MHEWTLHEVRWWYWLVRHWPARWVILLTEIVLHGGRRPVTHQVYVRIPAGEQRLKAYKAMVAKWHERAPGYLGPRATVGEWPGVHIEKSP